MIRQSATISASIVVLLISGCQLPEVLKRDAGDAPAPAPKLPGVPKLPGGLIPKLPSVPSPKTPTYPSPAVTSMPTTEPQSQPMQPMPAACAIAQVGYTCQSGQCDGGQCQSNCQQNDCQQNNCQRRGCLSCARCQPERPHGYLETTPQGWNLYGIDPQEFICDGGDHPPDAHLLQNDTVDGLQPEDTVVHYTTEAGDIYFQASNRECLYSPRFATVRKITAAVAGEKTIGLAKVDRPTQINRIGGNQPGLVVIDTTGPERAEVARQIDAMRARNRGVPVERVMGPLLAEKVLPALATLTALQLDELREDQLALIQRAANNAVAWTIGESVEVAVEDLKPPVLTRDQKLEAFTIYEFPDEGRLRILKLADRDHAQPGETVTFSIRVENVGDSAVNQVVLNDNLITRLEYVDGSQTSTRDADFAAYPNSEQSARLEWKLKEPLEVGESVTFEFKCLVR